MGKIAEFFKNVAGQFASEELLKVLAGVAGVFLAVAFFFTSWIPTDKGSYVMIVEGVLWGYALAQGVASNVTKQ
jgi:hypothetical protein